MTGSPENIPNKKHLDSPQEGFSIGNYIYLGGNLNVV